VFEAQFDWPDALIRLPFDSPEIAPLLAELDADPERLSRVQRSNVRNAALRHDWVHRVREVFEALGLPPTAEMLAREERLRDLAELAAEAGAGRESGSSERAGRTQPTSTPPRAATASVERASRAHRYERSEARGQDHDGR